MKRNSEKKVDGHQYLFTGDVHPVNLAISAGDYRVLSIKFGEIVFNVTNSKITGSVLTSVKANRVEYLRESIHSAVQGYIDLIAATQGVHLHIELQELVDVESRSITLLPLSRSLSVAKIEEERKTQLASMAKRLFNSGHSNTLHRILADINRSFFDVVEAGFFCYRAIEAMRGLFFEKDDFSGKDGDSRYWQAFRSVVGLEYEDVMRIKRSADAPRHGDYFNMNIDEYDWIVRFTWDALFVSLQKHIELIDGT